MKPAVNILTYNGASAFLKEAIESVYPYVDEIRVCDTGSIDGTKELLEKYNKVILTYEDVQPLGETWTKSAKDIALTRLLNELKQQTQSEWILKMDDDEIFPKVLMEEILELNGKYPIYSIPFKHIGRETKRRLVIKRLFLNIPDVSWVGIYGSESLAFRGFSPPSRKCPILKNHFLHLGDLRQNLDDRKHDYNFQ